MLELVLLALCYGLIGLVVESVFTGFHSMFFLRDPAGTSKTYVTMIPLYAVAGLTLFAIREAWHLPIFLAALLYAPIMLAYEYAYGMFWDGVFKYVPWDYSGAKWSVKGYIRLDFIPFWYLLGVLFEPLTVFLLKAI